MANEYAREYKYLRAALLRQQCACLEWGAAVRNRGCGVGDGGPKEER